MTRYAIDAPVALELIRHGSGRSLPAGDSLVGPAVLRSDVLVLLYALPDDTGRALLDELAALRLRLLGDRVSRAVAWRIARELGWSDPRPAEYLAVAQLQADVLVTADPQLLAGAHAAAIPTAEPSALE
ncbi:hypothetical protein [Cellulomonas sp. NPDC089187]|uniref:hypothetical protein n=1 Tax=Cellulomonas sp. NPDC089187 TaxID=3154970 RepID=UPI0034356424